MTNRYRVSLGGVQLDSLDNDILILDVGYSNYERKTSQYVTANLDGYDIHDVYVAKQAITISFELRIYDIKKRNEALQKINVWASAGGTLKTNDRDKQYITVICDQYAVLGSVRNWTDPLTLVFVSTTNPYWLSNTQTTLTLTGKASKGTFKLDGNTGKSLVSVKATATEAFTSFKVTVGSTTLKLTGLSVGVGKELQIDYRNNRYLRIRVDGSSVLSKLLPESNDVLLADCGKSNSVAIDANGRVTAVITARGCWL